ncbi:four helix bundle protein [Fluviicola taffensis]|uniref:CHP02436-containing protein n=1 Tax=Fluviicola taffensis (strain DSM 16823 / NCIMB 13979 / RW262) TaxID=755732 RepID=F2IAL6_FLUTR|nr:four helix bundle protein [Fluviicola taffensis]AEA43152.1 CHP02436-containing protein [Fluviicola taffensis DSM 16823]
MSVSELRINSVVQDKSFLFAQLIIRFCLNLKDQKHYELSSQLIRSGTSVGANVREAQRAESKKDFKHKLRIALKEADETKYWLELIHSEITTVDKAIFELNEELVKLLVAIIKNTQD